MPGNGALYVSSSPSRNSPSRSAWKPSASSAAATVRRTYGQRSRMTLTRENSPVSVLPTIALVRSFGSPSAIGKPASAIAAAAMSRASQWVRSVERYVLPAIRYLSRSNSYPSMTAACSA